MLKFFEAQVRYRRARTVALGAALALASASFILLSSAATSSNVRVRGSVESNFRNAYDILVRPRRSFTQLERAEGLVRDNYLSGISGGITLAQHRRIKMIRGVEVAAPIANIGYVMPSGAIRVPIDETLTRDPSQLYRLRLTWVAQRGLSRYPASDKYVYYTRRGIFECCSQGIAQLMEDGLPAPISAPFYAGRPYAPGPFGNSDELWLFSALTPGQGSDRPDLRYPNLKVGAAHDFVFPISLAAIDPEEEAKLLHLDRALVEGRYLTSSDRARVLPNGRGGRWRYIPIIASTKSFIDERLHVDVERLEVPAGTNIAAVLASPGSYSFLTRLRGIEVSERDISSSGIWQTLAGRRDVGIFHLWEVDETRYRGAADVALEPQAARNPISIWRSPYFPDSGNYYLAPPANEDVQFRRLHGFPASNTLGAGNVVRTPFFRIVGRYDPDELPGFSALSRVPLETYYPPELRPADESSERALGGKPLLPTQSLGDYVQQPPLMLTTLKGMEPFLNPVFFKGAGRKARAPISVIRIRVKGVRGPDGLSQARIKAVALAIRDATGLDVDITSGSSPRTLLVELPAGKFGRPALKLEEGWIKKGVSVAFLRAVDKKSLALFALILVICAFFVANGTFAAVRTRRSEIGTLLCLGWPQRAIFTAVLGELALLGVIAGVLGSVLATGAVAAFGLEMPVARALLVFPIAVGLAILAGVWPARAAARGLPLDAVRPVIAGKVERRRVRSLPGMAAANLRRLPARSLVGALGLLVGVGTLALLLGINRAFKGTLVDTLLGQEILFRIKGVDFLAVAVTIALAGLSIADVLFLNLRERAAELVTLRTVGWTDGHLRRLIALEGLALGLVGGLAGAVLAFLVGALALGVPAAPLALSALLALVGGVFVALLASIVPLTQIARMTPPKVLADEFG